MKPEKQFGKLNKQYWYDNPVIKDFMIERGLSVQELKSYIPAILRRSYHANSTFQYNIGNYIGGSVAGFHIREYGQDGTGRKYDTSCIFKSMLHFGYSYWFRCVIDCYLDSNLVFMRILNVPNPFAYVIYRVENNDYLVCDTSQLAGIDYGYCTDTNRLKYKDFLTWFIYKNAEVNNKKKTIWKENQSKMLQLIAV